MQMPINLFSMTVKYTEVISNYLTIPDCNVYYLDTEGWEETSNRHRRTPAAQNLGRKMVWVHASAAAGIHYHANRGNSRRRPSPSQGGSGSLGWICSTRARARHGKFVNSHAIFFLADRPVNGTNTCYCVTEQYFSLHMTVSSSLHKATTPRN
jgi:hypothetical protein